MAPIRLGIIGLSSSAVTSWASSAHLPYLLSPRGRTKYTIVALCNSSVAAAEAAVQTYAGLQRQGQGQEQDPWAPRTYGTPEALAADPDVDLVVCCTRVDTHYALVKPSIEAGKAVYVEWPLTQDVEHSRALLATLVAAQQRADGGVGGRSVVGLQGRVAPLVQRMREFLEAGSLGKVLSSEVRAYGGTMDREGIKEGLRYFGDRKIGGNVYMITFAHMFDYVQTVLGEVTELQSRFQLQRPEMKLRNDSGQETGSMPSDVPDLVLANGTLSDESIAQRGATVSVRYRRGQPFKGEPAFTWYIGGEKGELRLVSPTGSSLHANAYSDSEPVTLEWHDHATDEVRPVDWTWPPWQEENGIPFGARSVARMYEAFYANAVEGRPREYPDFADAIRRHEQLHSMLSKWGPG